MHLLFTRLQNATEVDETCSLPSDPEGGDTPIYSVLRSSSSVKMKVKGQPPKIADSQTAFWLDKSQRRLSRRIRILHFITGKYPLCTRTRPYTICDISD